MIGAISAQNIKKSLKNAQFHIDFERYELADEHANNALSIEPENAKANYFKGKILCETYRKADALPYLKKAYEVDKTVEKDLMWYYALTLQFNQKFEEAKPMYLEYAQQYTPEEEEYKKAMLAIKKCDAGKNLLSNEKKQVIKNLGDGVNSKYMEYAPVLNKDETLLYFTSRKPGLNKKKKKKKEFYHDEDIYVSQLVDSVWQKSKSLGKPVNSKKHDASVCFGPDGTFYIYRHPKKNISFTKKEGDKWTKPEKWDVEFNTKYYEPSVFFSKDGNTLFYVTDAPGGFGEKDIYISKKGEDGKWKKGDNMGALINTPYDEDAPFLSPDGKTLYFSSRGHKGLGGYDIFKTELVDGTWTKPENLGAPINSMEDDIYFILAKNGETGYYSSGRPGGLGSQDIYMVFMIEEEEKDLDSIPDTNITKDPIVFAVNLSGNIKSHVDKIPLDALINGNGQGFDTTTTSDDLGNYKLGFEKEGEYLITVSKDGYLTNKQKVNLKEGDNKKNVYLWKIGTIATLKNVYFDFDKSTLKDESQKTLNNVYKFLEHYPEIRLEIQGHTDYIGSEYYNQKLSEKRAKSVKVYLVQKGIVDNRLETKGYGEKMPVAPNNTKEGRAKNRRTDIKIIE